MATPDPAPNTDTDEPLEEQSASTAPTGEAAEPTPEESALAQPLYPS